MAAQIPLRLPGDVWLVDVCGLRFQVERIGKTDRWLLIGGGAVAREAAQRVLTPPPSADARAPTWVFVHVDEEDAKALSLGQPFPRPQSVRQFAWCYDGDPIPNYALGEIGRLCRGPAAPVPPDSGKTHPPDQFL